jgi:predicted O-linked N-acetylglucosamine transferase (SPINDLY family)
LNNIGVIHRDLDRLPDAIHYFTKALAVNPRLPEALYNLGVCAQKRGDHHAGLDYYRKALAANAEYPPARWLHALSLPMLYDRPEEIDSARRRFEVEMGRLIEDTGLTTPLEQSRALIGIGCTTNFYLQYQGKNDRALQKKYGDFVSRAMGVNFPAHSIPIPMPRREPHQKIRIGYVSSFMRSHTVGVFLLGWLQSHDRSKFELFGYHVGNKRDALTSRIADTLDRFADLGSNLNAAIERIAADRPQILIFTDVGMDPITLQLAGLRLAPVQCKGWGHPVTTGLPTMDFYLSSDEMEPEDAQDHYTEQLIRLPHLALHFDPPPMPREPSPRHDFGLEESAFIYLSTQSLFKYLPQYDHIFPAIAVKVARARFVFIGHSDPCVTERFKNRLRKAFAEVDLSADHFCRFMPRLTYEKFLSLNMAADVLLDTMDWSGGKTTLEAIACGLPVITLPGRFMRGRHAYAMLRIMEIPDTIAGSVQGYCSIAVRLAEDADFLQRMRATVRERRDRLFHDRRFMEALESFFVTTVTSSKQSSKTAAFKKDDGSSEEEQEYRTLLTQASFDPRVRYNLGTLLLEKHRFHEARTMLMQAAAVAPDSAPVHNNLGKAQQALGDMDSAEASFRSAIRIDSGFAPALFNLAEIFAHLKREDEAIDFYRKAIDADPTMGAAFNNLGNLHRRRKEFGPAIECYRRVIEQSPQLAEGHYNLGSAFRDFGELGAALVHLSQAVKLKPKYAEAWNNLALTVKSMGDMDRALAYFNRALQLAPNLAIAHWNRSFVFLLKDDYINGWKDFEWRFRIPDWKTIYPFRLQGRRWNGESAAESSILVHDEQGLGDTLQFARYLPQVKQRCREVVLETRPELMAALRNIPGVDRLVERPLRHPGSCSFDFYVPLMSLPAIFGTTAATVPFECPYIFADEKKRALWHERIPEGAVKIGLVWAGRPEHRNDRNRSCRLEEFEMLREIPGAVFVSLQKGSAVEQIKGSRFEGRIVDMGSQTNDFADTAAILTHLDLLITVDTAVAHLAGAMGRPVWVLIPFIADWRWGLRRADTPWYPSMRLFRQTTAGQWPPVIKRICNAVRTALPRFTSQQFSGANVALKRR